MIGWANFKSYYTWLVLSDLSPGDSIRNSFYSQPKEPPVSNSEIIVHFSYFLLVGDDMVVELLTNIEVRCYNIWVPGPKSVVVSR